MKITIKTDKIDFEFEQEFKFRSYFGDEYEDVISFVKQCIEKVSDESNKIKEWH